MTTRWENRARTASATPDRAVAPARAEEVTAGPGRSGAPAFSLPEVPWRAAELKGVAVGSPAVGTTTVARLARGEVPASRVTLLAGFPAHLGLIDEVLAGLATGAPPAARVEVGAWPWPAGGRARVGARPFPAHTARAARDEARAAVARPRPHLVSVTAYEGRLAGIGAARPGQGRRHRPHHRPADRGCPEPPGADLPPARPAPGTDAPQRALPLRRPAGRHRRCPARRGGDQVGHRPANRADCEHPSASRLVVGGRVADTVPAYRATTQDVSDRQPRKV
ncbi:hypothetical protein EES47_25425 [Streptomyces sp. ADI98-12]|uniref:Uncharacterized protein n=1 Tax=Streptomyces diastaticus subsp. diastaticus TaxID=68040 RepID=A0ABQ1CR47_STRDI|nr:hypothetical protein EES47_25425 [Streptomyces sp. ADI98-12]GFH67318.1 hypothetical protein Srut_38320 [Streptomyces rutgersensis]GFH72596.1 hypothetical protein Sdia_33640 [Streptomyces diastaticus subsp. diastaticus]GGU23434.1 hypothetical protein GCM10015534_27810 [Streptomyces diastaticus subsp. diastaticus]